MYWAIQSFIRHGIMPPASIEFCDSQIFSKFEQAVKDDGSVGLLPFFSRGCLGRILYVRLQRSKGNVGEAVSKAVSGLKRIETAFEALKEHERLMDKDFFEMLGKGDSFLVIGRQKETGSPLFWRRYGFPPVERFKKRGDSPKAHAIIRHAVCVCQIGTARAISDGEYQNNYKRHPVIVNDCVGHLTIFYLCWLFSLFTRYSDFLPVCATFVIFVHAYRRLLTQCFAKY